MILGAVSEEAKKQGIENLISGEETVAKIFQFRGGKINTVEQHALILELPLGTSSDDSEKVMKIANECKAKLNSEVDIELEQKLGKGTKLPNFGNIKKVFEEGEAELSAKEGQVLLIDVWATWCGPCQKPMAHNQAMLEKNNWGDKVRIVGVSVDDDVESIKNRVQTRGWEKVEHLTLGGWKNDHSLIKSFSISGIPFVCLVDTHGNIYFTGHPSEIDLEEKINELIKDSSSSNEEKKEVKEVDAGDINKLNSTLIEPKFFEEHFGKSEFISTKVTIISTGKNGKVTSVANIVLYTYENQKQLLETYKNLIPSKNITFQHNIVQTVKVPELPTSCQQCKSQLKYPVYWCYWSPNPSTFRCRTCIQKIPSPKQYNYKYNSILLPAPVDKIAKKHLGKNLQPDKLEDVQSPNQFGCNGCGSCPEEIGVARYVCLGCRSQPNYRGDYVDLCSACVEGYLNGNAEVQASLENDGHEQNHPFLRILYNVKGYFEF